MEEGTKQQQGQVPFKEESLCCSLSLQAREPHLQRSGPMGRW